MIDESRRCAFCGDGLSGTDAIVGIPDLLIEMHDACYRLHLKTDTHRTEPSPSAR